MKFSFKLLLSLWLSFILGSASANLATGIAIGSAMDNMALGIAIGVALDSSDSSGSEH